MKVREVIKRLEKEGASNLCKKTFFPMDHSLFPIPKKRQVFGSFQNCSVPEKDGWYLARTRGSNRQFKHLDKIGTVTVSGNLGVDMPIGT